MPIFYRERGKPHIDLPISDFGLVGPPLDLPVMDRGAARIFLRELGVRKIMGTALEMNENHNFDSSLIMIYFRKNCYS